MNFYMKWQNTIGLSLGDETCVANLYDKVGKYRHLYKTLVKHHFNKYINTTITIKIHVFLWIFTFTP